MSNSVVLQRRCYIKLFLLLNILQGKGKMVEEYSRAVRKQRQETGGFKDNFLSEMVFELASKVR